MCPYIFRAFKFCANKTANNWRLFNFCTLHKICASLIFAYLSISLKFNHIVSIQFNPLRLFNQNIICLLFWGDTIWIFVRLVVFYKLLLILELLVSRKHFAVFLCYARPYCANLLQFIFAQAKCAKLKRVQELIGSLYQMKLCREKFTFVAKQNNPSISPNKIIHPISVELSLVKVKMNLRGTHVIQTNCVYLIRRIFRWAKLFVGNFRHF